jgi:hypothetical protein
MTTKKINCFEILENFINKGYVYVKDAKNSNNEK